MAEFVHCTNLTEAEHRLNSIDSQIFLFQRYLVVSKYLLLTRMIPPEKLTAFVISLRRAHHRRDRLLPSLDALLKAEIVEAVDGRLLSPAELTHLCPDRYCARQMREMTPSEIACSASHVRALQTFLAGQSRFGLILEDDALVDGEGMSRLESVLDAFPEFEILKVAGVEPVTARGRMAAKIAGVQVLAVTTFGGGGFGYVVSRAAAARIVRRAFPVREPFDCYLRSVHVHGCTIHETAPRLVGLHESNDQSTIGHRPAGKPPPFRKLPSVLAQRLAFNLGRIVVNLRRFGPSYFLGSSLVRLPTSRPVPHTVPGIPGSRVTPVDAAPGRSSV